MLDNEEHPLKSTYKRIRKPPKRKERRAHQSTLVVPVKERHIDKKKACEIVSESFSAERINFLLDNEKDADWLGRVARVGEKMKRRLHKSLSDAKHEMWRKNLSDIDIYHLNLAENPLNYVRETILKLPTLLDKMYTLSSLDVMPYNYRRDHLWLTLQWEIDEVENPFNARACQSTECLGSFIQFIDKDQDDRSMNEDGRLPELIPLTVLDEYREQRRQGMTTKDFKKKQMEKNEKQGNFSGADVWAPPKCAICKMQDLFETAMDPTKKKKTISLADYHVNFCFQFTGMLPQYVINSRAINFSLSISETGIAAPNLDIPVVGLVVNALRRSGKEIVVKNLY